LSSRTRLRVKKFATHRPKLFNAFKADPSLRSG
jgi:hypothetical protein